MPGSSAMNSTSLVPSSSEWSRRVLLVAAPVAMRVDRLAFIVDGEGSIQVVVMGQR